MQILRDAGLLAVVALALVTVKIDREPSPSPVSTDPGSVSRAGLAMPGGAGPDAGSNADDPAETAPELCPLKARAAASAETRVSRETFVPLRQTAGEWIIVIEDDDVAATATATTPRDCT